MTTFLTEPVRCSVCGDRSDHDVLMSTNTYGSPDLDLRPPEMQRSTMRMWIQECPGCGYCAPDLSEPLDGARRVVSGGAYRDIRSDTRYSDLARLFLSRALIEEELGAFDQAGWHALNAAWDCDDQGLPEAAVWCRLRALDSFRSARRAGLSFAEDEDTERILLVDLLRRTGQVHKALELCSAEVSQDHEVPIAAILAFQRELILRQDRAAHTLAEATREADVLDEEFDPFEGDDALELSDLDDEEGPVS